MKFAKAYAPCSIGNVGPGFDVFGLALGGAGDEVEAFKIDEELVRIRAIHGDGGRLPREADKNTAGIAALETLKQLATKRGEKFGVELVLKKGLPLNSGLGSSASSAAAAAVAVNALSHDPLPKAELLEACIKAESEVSGFHADNVAPSLLGGFIVVESMKPLRWSRIEPKFEIPLGVITPALEVPTKRAREVVPRLVEMEKVVSQIGAVSTMLCGLYDQDLQKLARGVNDQIVEPARAQLIHGFDAVKAFAMKQGALCFSISGSGPTVFLICEDFQSLERVSYQVVNMWREMGIESTIQKVGIDSYGSRILE